MDELRSLFAEVVKEYPYEAERRLQTVARKFRRAVIAKTPSGPGKHKRKLVKSYKLSKPKGYHEETKVEFWSSAPHFHLIERGHAKVTKSGRNVGFVPGRHMVERTVQEFVDEMPAEAAKFVQKMADRMR